MVASRIHSCTDSPVFRFVLFAVAMTTTDSVWWIRYMAGLLPEEEGQRAKEKHHGNFQQGLECG
jgi:hypothetical protein